MTRRLIFACVLVWLRPIVGAEVSMLAVRVTDNYGNAVTPSRIVLERDGQSIALSDSNRVEVQYGTYHLVVRAPGFSESSSDAVVDQPKQVLSVALQLGAIEGPLRKCSVYGKVSPFAAATRVRIIQVFGSKLTDVAIGDEGAYGFTGLECGDYVVLVLGPKGCLMEQRSHLTQDSRLDFALSAADTDRTCPAAK